MNAPPKPLMVAGPTAVGKSEIALRLAERLGAEIISVDSMQVYRGMDIGTAKPSLAEQARVPHHLIDVVDLHETFDAAAFARLARVAMTEIQARGRVPLFCGGTGLYFQAFWHGLGQAPPADQALRAELAQVPLDELLEELKRTDPTSFETIDRQNRRRVVRAIEVIRLTGCPFSGQRAPWAASGHAEPWAALAVGLERPRPELCHRIEERVDAMFRAGLMEEVQSLLVRGLGDNRTPLQAVGYRQICEYLQGARSLPETIALVKQKTRQLAKRQMTWFKHQAALSWLTLEPTSSPEQMALEIERRYRAKSDHKQLGHPPVFG